MAETGARSKPPNPAERLYGMADARNTNFPGNSSISPAPKRPHSRNLPLQAIPCFPGIIESKAEASSHANSDDAASLILRQPGHPCLCAYRLAPPRTADPTPCGGAVVSQYARRNPQRLSSLQAANPVLSLY